MPTDINDDEVVDIVVNDVMLEADDVDIEVVYLELMCGMALDEVVDVVEALALLEYAVEEMVDILDMVDEMPQHTEVDDEVEVDVLPMVVLDADANECL